MSFWERFGRNHPPKNSITKIIPCSHNARRNRRGTQSTPVRDPSSSWPCTGAKNGGPSFRHSFAMPPANAVSQVESQTARHRTHSPRCGELLRRVPTGRGQSPAPPHSATSLRRTDRRPLATGTVGSCFDFYEVLPLQARHVDRTFKMTPTPWTFTPANGRRIPDAWLGTATTFQHREVG